MKWARSMAVIATLVVSGGCGHDSREAADGQAAARDTAADSSVARTVTLSAEAIAANDVQTVEIHRNSGYVTTRFPGRLEFNRNTTADVLSPLEGRLKEWRVREGDNVQAGDVLALVESPQNLGNPVPVRSPLAGEVIEQSGVLGGPVRTDQPVFIVGDVTTLWGVADVREDMAGRIIADAGATLRVPAFAGETFRARLLRSGARVSPETRTVSFYVEVPNRERRLRAGMFAYISLATDRIRDQLCVPEEAIQNIDGDDVVFVQVAPGRYRAATVTLGKKTGDAQEILAGLSDGDTVVARGGFIVKSQLLRDAFASED